MICPGCTVAEMEELTLDALYGGALVVDVCHSCHSLWFDGKESIQLSPGATLELFRLIHEKQAETPVPLVDGMKCPRCASALALTRDLQRGTWFTYFRCPQNHGRHTPFFQFLKEKNLIKPLTPRQLAELRAQVKTVRCSNCGAPVDLAHGTVCGHCQAPLSALDPTQVERTLNELKAHDQKRKNVDPNVAAQLIMDRLSVASFYTKLDRQEPGARFRNSRRGGWGLVEAGIGAIVDLIT